RRQPGRVHPVVHHLAHRRRTIGIHQHRQLRHQTAALLQHVEHRRLPQPPPVQVRGIQEIGDVVDVPLLLERVQNRVGGIEPRIGLQQLLTHLTHPAHPPPRQPRGRRPPRQVGHPPVPALLTQHHRTQPGGHHLIHLRQARRPHHTPVPQLPGPPPRGPHQSLHRAQLLLTDRTATRRTGGQLRLQRRQRPLHVRLTVAPIRLQQRRPPHQLATAPRHHRAQRRTPLLPARLHGLAPPASAPPRRPPPPPRHARPARPPASPAPPPAAASTPPANRSSAPRPASNTALNRPPISPDPPPPHGNSPQPLTAPHHHPDR